MADGTLVNRSPLDAEAIDYDSFTASLLSQAQAAGLLDEPKAAEIQQGLLALLGAQIGRLTRGESSSIPASVADGLMDGIGYCVDFCLRAQPSLDASLALLTHTPADELYRQGKELLDAHAKACEALLSRVRATRTRTVNEGYNITLDSTLPGLLREWKAAPFPHDFTVLTEYPLARDYASDGISGVHDRLAALALENRFCARFSRWLDGLLEDYARQNRVSPEEAYVNLFSLAARNLILARLLGREDPTLTEADLSVLEERLSGLDGPRREALLLRAARSLADSCAFENPRLDEYLLEEAARFARAVDLAGGRLRAAAVAHPEDGRLVHVDGQRLDDDAFAAVAEELLLCDTAARKARLIREELRSLEDLVDLLDSGCIFEEELPEVFSSFDGATCSLLLTRCPVEAAGRQIALSDESSDWQDCFADWLNALPAGRLGSILGAYRAFIR